MLQKILFIFLFYFFPQIILQDGVPVTPFKLAQQFVYACSPPRPPMSEKIITAP